MIELGLGLGSTLGCLAFVGGLFIGYWVIFGAPKAASRALQEKFIRLGTLAGRTRGEIESVVGSPSSISTAGPSMLICSWWKQNYHIVLSFENGVCKGVVNETVTNRIL